MDSLVPFVLPEAEGVPDAEPLPEAVGSLGVSITDGLALQENVVNMLAISKQVFKKFLFIIKFFKPSL